MRAVRLHSDAGSAGLSLDDIEVPEPGAGDALVRVHAAAITRDELEWPVGRLPAIPSYELSGVVEAIGAGVAEPAVGTEVYALTAFDRDGAPPSTPSSPRISWRRSRNASIMSRARRSRCRA